MILSNCCCAFSSPKPIAILQDKLESLIAQQEIIQQEKPLTKKS